MLATSTGLSFTLTKPATCGQELPLPAPQITLLVGDVELASGANSDWSSVPDEAVESLEAIVLFTMLTASASTSETPPPSQPATLLTMMLFVTLTEFQRQVPPAAPRSAEQAARRSSSMRTLGMFNTSVPLTCCKRNPPPLPESAALPRIRLALTTSPGPLPSLGVISPGAGKQSRSVETPQVVGSASGAPITSRPPPLVVIDGLVVWLKRILLCSMRPFLMKPMCETPPPSPELRLPQTQLLANL